MGRFARSALDVEPNRIRLLSLGTGCFEPDPLRPGSFGGLLYWGAKLKDLVLSGQEYDKHLDMRDAGLASYSRVDPFLPRAFELDAQSDSDLRHLHEIGLIAIEDAYSAEDNAF